MANLWLKARTFHHKTGKNRNAMHGPHSTSPSHAPAAYVHGCHALTEGIATGVGPKPALARGAMPPPAFCVNSFHICRMEFHICEII